MRLNNSLSRPRAGINVAMVYGIEQHPAAEQLAFLDDIAKDGLIAGLVLPLERL